MKLVCSPSRLAKVMKLLSPEHIEKIISDTGLGCLNMIREFKLRRIMLIRLAKSFDSETSSITIGKTPIPITAEDVHHIFGLAIEGEDIDKKLESAPDPNLFNTFQKNGSIDLADLETEILSSKTPDNDFLARFVLFAIGTVLAPTTQSYVDAKYLKLVADIKSLPRLNWGCFTMKHLFMSIHKFNSLDQVSLQGNLPLLQVSATSLVNIVQLFFFSISLYIDEVIYCEDLVLGAPAFRQIDVYSYTPTIGRTMGRMHVRNKSRSLHLRRSS